jgi:MFS family permease
MSPTLPAAPKQPTRTGWELLLTSVAFFMVITAASIGERFGRRRVYVAGLALFSLASAACALAPSTTLLIAARVAPRDMGTASGVLNMLQRFGGVVAVAVASAVFASNGHLGTAVSFDSGFRPALLERPACPSLALSLPSSPAEPGPRPST